MPRLGKRPLRFLDLNHLPNSKDSVVIIADWVTAYYEADLLTTFSQLIERLGYQAYILTSLENGKTFAVNGFRKQFKHIAMQSYEVLEKLAQAKLPLIGCDPAMALTFRFEYPDILQKPAPANVMLLQEWLMSIKTQIPQKQPATSFRLFSHCTEQANCPEATKQWQAVFAQFGLTLDLLRAGCCGMAGSYGHETQHIDNSLGLFELSWQPYFSDNQSNDTLLVDGFSCRAQVLRCTGVAAKHPAQALLEALS